MAGNLLASNTFRVRIILEFGKIETGCCREHLQNPLWHGKGSIEPTFAVLRRWSTSRHRQGVSHCLADPSGSRIYRYLIRIRHLLFALLD